MRRQLVAEAQEFALDNGNGALALAALYLAQDDGRDLVASCGLYGEVIGELSKELATGLELLRHEDGHSPAWRGYQAAVLGYIAKLIARSAASLEAAVEAAESAP